jgi:sugar O-acyltransferase (sialic acid O-acetyltransferase NeuD family)
LKRIAILGAGGQAREVSWLIRDINREHPAYEFLGYIVENVSKLGKYDTRENVLGGESWLQANRGKVDCLAIGIGTPAVRIKVASSLSQQFPEIEWPGLIHPRSILDRETCILHPGALLCAGTICATNVTLGRFSLINFGSTIGHDAEIGKGCVVNPGANISGGVIVQDGVLIGTGAQVLQYLRIGASATVGAGAVVVKDVAAGCTVVGIPAKTRNS